MQYFILFLFLFAIFCRIAGFIHNWYPAQFWIPLIVWIGNNVWAFFKHVKPKVIPFIASVAMHNPSGY